MKLLVFILVTMTMGGSALAAESYRRLVNFEWEAIEGASSYQVELKQTKEDGKTFNFKVKEAMWNGKLTPGNYIMRLRSSDERGVPGEWSPPSPFEVGLESVRLTFPAPKAELAGKRSDEEKINFRWEPAGGASTYHFELQSDDGEFKVSEDLKDTNISVKVPAAKNFTWKVNAFNSEKIASEAVSVGQFSLLGAPLEKPLLEKPENEFVREVQWKNPDNAEKYDVAIGRYRPETKKWEKVQGFTDVSSSNVNIDEKWPGGIYRISVRAKGKLRKNSDVAVMNFKVHKGSRTPAAEFTHEVRKSIDRTNGWYGIASYLITQVKYSATNLDTEGGATTSYSATGGTGRLGAGHFTPDSNWGFLGVLDLSGFITNDNKNLTYMSAEISSVWRTNVGERGELRAQMGGYYKEHQVALTDIDSNGAGFVSNYDKVVVLGPHVGAEYWHSVTPKLGFQANLHLYMSLFKMKTPNGQTADPSMSNQLGFLASYRVTQRFTGLVGVAQREDLIKYKSSQGGTNEAKLNGTYLNFFAEYSF